MTGHHAIVFGASGITGWSITDQILKGYPTNDTFAKVTALTNRPLPLEDTLWPKSDKLQMAQVNLMNDGGQEALEADLKGKIKDIETVSHVYFFAYIMDPDPKKECEINVLLLERAVKAIEKLSTKLAFVVLPTGTKAYGVHMIDEFPFSKDLPLKETLPRIPEPWASQMFYYTQLDYLTAASKGKSWTWCDVVPDFIVGFVPNNNIYCLAQILSLYLSLYRYKNGKGTKVPFPGTDKSWKILSNDSPQDSLAAFSIYASLRPKTHGNGQRFNTGIMKETSWSERWPLICDYFGLKGVAPTADSPQPSQYLEENIQDWQKIEQEFGLVKGKVGNQRTFGGFPYFIMTMFNFDRQMDMDFYDKSWPTDNKLKDIDCKDGWYLAFDRFKAAGIIPEFK